MFVPRLFVIVAKDGGGRPLISIFVGDNRSLWGITVHFFRASREQVADPMIEA
uniref:Uncharacterized protein n=1 Tax=Bacterium symbiont subsp. Theonella swinhoei (strain pTSMAC1) TaxID=1221190 RepID=J9ZW33_BACS1|nr:unknown protein [bacterium symbiont of Theonella swinhoei pTSMAC1]